jgi:glycerol kinase
MNTGPAPRLSSQGLLTTVAWQLPGGAAYALDGGIFATGAAVQWVAEGLHFLPDVAASAQAAEQAADAAVTFVPALAGLAAPYWQTEVRGAIFGLSRATTPADIVRATLAGIACRTYEVVKAMEDDAGLSPAFLKVDGGPAANTYLMQFLADLLDREVHVAAEREATAFGAAHLAAHAALGVSLDALAARWRTEAVYTPRKAAAERGEILARWQSALAAVRRFHGLTEN